MKTERRHELQTNWLADWLGQWIKKLSPYSRAILAGVIAIVALLAFKTYWQSQSIEQQRMGWNEFFGAFSSNQIADLDAVATVYTGEPVATWSQLLMADNDLAGGIELMFSDRATAKDKLRNARQLYLTVSHEAADAMLRQRAFYGIARANEALGEKEDLDQARSNYQRLIDDWPDGAFAEAAGGRIAELDKESTKIFLDWFAQQAPSPAVGLGSLPGTPGLGPGFNDNSLPTGPSQDSGGGFGPGFGLDLPTTGGGPDDAEDGTTFVPFDPLGTATDDADSPENEK